MFHRLWSRVYGLSRDVRMAAFWVCAPMLLVLILDVASAASSSQIALSKLSCICICPSQTLLNPPSISKQSTRLLEAQSVRFGIYTPQTDPTCYANAGIDDECPCWRQELHHWQKSKPNNEICSPISTCAQSRAQRAHVEREQLALHPRDIAKAKCICSNIEHDTG